MTEQILEILIGKYLDGEIAPSEQQMLEAELDSDPNARKLLAQLQDLHERSREVIASEILQKGKAAEEIIERAWRRQTKRPLHRKIKAGGWLRFVSGLAAGVIIGLALHFTLLGPSTPPAIARNAGDQPEVQRLTPLPSPLRGARNVTRNVDWYSLTDENGDQWLIEGFRENVVRPTVHHASL